MNRQLSPFAQLTGAEKQIRWLEYQSIRLPYVPIAADTGDVQPARECSNDTAASRQLQQAQPRIKNDRPQPPPEVPRTMPAETQSRHRQYDAVIARLKQAELQSRSHSTHLVK